MDLELRLKALDFATKFHAGQKRKDGKDYITHVIAVAEFAQEIYKEVVRQSGDTTSLNEKWGEEFLDELYVLGVLHDTVEDTAATIEDIQEQFGYYIASAVGLLTRQPGQSYFDFIMRLVKEYDFLPIYVKLADLKHNMSDLNEGSLKDKYRFANQILRDVIAEAAFTS